jgi:beta-glucosidase
MEKRHYPAIPGFFGGSSAEHDGWAMEPELLSKYFTITDDPQKADFGIAFIRNPMSGYGYDIKDAQKGGSGYVPISLQYNDYTARYSRRKSIAGGDPYENFTNRSYRGKSVKTYNKSDMYAVTGMKKKLGDKPLITIISMDNPMVMGEIEKYSDVILVGLGIQNQAYLDILIGKYKVSGKLPFQLPADMKTVEGQNEDAPRDMRCYKDSEGNIYDFGFGLSD